ncbi:MAG: hypothetical protein QXS37_05980, partial [Candidatus Aenigmatarchaeota archaeon]
IPKIYEYSLGVHKTLNFVSGLSKVFRDAGAPVQFVTEQVGKFVDIATKPFVSQIAELMAAQLVGVDRAFQMYQRRVREENILFGRLEDVRGILRRFGLMPREGGFDIRTVLFLERMWGISPQALIKHQKEFVKILTEDVTSSEDMSNIMDEIKKTEDLSLKTMLDQKSILEIISNTLSVLTDSVIAFIGKFVPTPVPPGAQPSIEIREQMKTMVTAKS